MYPDHACTKAWGGAAIEGWSKQGLHWCFTDHDIHSAVGQPIDNDSYNILKSWLRPCSYNLRQSTIPNTMLLLPVAKKNYF
jgi:hypothetical protein